MFRLPQRRQARGLAAQNNCHRTRKILVRVQLLGIDAGGEYLDALFLKPRARFLTRSFRKRMSENCAQTGP